MKDLKHLNYFENLLQDSGNELVDKARAAGNVCIGTTCYQIPEVLLNLTGCFAVRMRAPRTGSMEMGTYYMTSLNCEFARALLERCLEGGYGFLDCIIEPFACSQMTSTIFRRKTCVRHELYWMPKLRAVLPEQSHKHRQHHQAPCSLSQCKHYC